MPELAAQAVSQERTFVCRRGRRKPTSERYFNRELSQIAYHRRVMEGAKDRSQPLLERLRSLAFFEDGIDEFFMTRVSALKEQVAAGVVERSPDGMTPRQELAAIRRTLAPLTDEARNYLLDVLLPELRNQGIVLESYSSFPRANASTSPATSSRKCFRSALRWQSIPATRFHSYPIAA